MTLTETKILTAQQAATELRLSLRRVRELVRKREIPGAKIGRQYLIQAADLFAYLDRMKTAPIPPRGPNKRSSE